MRINNMEKFENIYSFIDKKLFRMVDEENIAFSSVKVRIIEHLKYEIFIIVKFGPLEFAFPAGVHNMCEAKTKKIFSMEISGGNFRQFMKYMMLDSDIYSYFSEIDGIDAFSIKNNRRFISETRKHEYVFPDDGDMFNKTQDDEELFDHYFHYLKFHKEKVYSSLKKKVEKVLDDNYDTVVHRIKSEIKDYIRSYVIGFIDSRGITIDDVSEILEEEKLKRVLST
jgi:hypothetical protein